MARQNLTKNDIENCIKLSMNGIRIKDLHEAIGKIIDSLKPIFDLIEENIEYLSEIKSERNDGKMEERKYSKTEILELFDKAVEKMDELVDEATKDNDSGFGKFMMKIQNMVVAGMIKNNLIEMVGADNEQR